MLRSSRKAAAVVKSIRGLERFAWLFIFLLVSAPSPARAWGDRAHRMVNAAAIENLPEPLRSYFRSSIAYLIDHASEPDLLARDNPEEKPHHYTEIDAADAYPFLAFQEAFVSKRLAPTAAERRHGDSVWQIERFALLLARAMRQGRWGEAERAAVFAAHYACDLTQPLHTVANYDGQLTNQTGIHARFETELVNALADRWAFQPRPPTDEPDLRARILRELLDSHSFCVPLLAADRIAAAGRTYQDPRYFPEFEKLAGPLARQRLEAGISFVSSLWYTAWVRAGRPDLSKGKIRRRRELSPRPLRLH